MVQPLSLAANRPGIDRSAAEYLDRATVVASSPARVEVELIGGRRVAAQLALALPYRPALDDELLVIGGASGYWVIGVISGRGTTELRLPGDVDLHAMNGRLRLRGDRGVDVAGESVSLTARTLRVAAETAVERFHNLVTHVREMMSSKAGERHTDVSGSSLETAKRVTILAEENVAVNGQQINLG
ncbi:MAG: DUF3540 domain-containing protein [Myxococcota bacterium]